MTWKATLACSLPFVGLALSVIWAARIMLPGGEPLRRLEAIAATVLLLAMGYGTYTRNRVWSNEEGLWRQTVERHPRSIRGLENYALTLSSRGRHIEAFDSLWTARRVTPQSNVETAEIEATMGMVTAALKRDDEADDHFHMAMSLAADRSICHFLYAHWLEEQGARDKGYRSLLMGVFPGALGPAPTVRHDAPL